MVVDDFYLLLVTLLVAHVLARRRREGVQRRLLRGLLLHVRLLDRLLSKHSLLAILNLRLLLHLLLLLIFNDALYDLRRLSILSLHNLIAPELKFRLLLFLNLLVLRLTLIL